jgi:hypothetical protein
MWTCSSFGNYLLSFQLKYINGNIFENNYVSLFSEIIANFIGLFVYTALGMRGTFIASFLCAILGAIAMLNCGEVYIPFNLLISRFGLTIAFLATYQASFNDNTFPIS